MLAYLATVAVNGPKTPLATTLVPERVDPKPPAATTGKTGWKYVYAEKGPDGFAKAVRAHKGIALHLLFCCPSARAEGWYIRLPLWGCL